MVKSLLRNMYNYNPAVLNYLLYGENSTNKNICLICFNIKGENLTNIFDQFHICTSYYEGNISIVNILESIYQHKVHFDILPNTVCIVCWKKLLEHFIFTKECQKNEAVWSKALNKISISIKGTNKLVEKKSEIKSENKNDDQMSENECTGFENQYQLLGDNEERKKSVRKLFAPKVEKQHQIKFDNKVKKIVIIRQPSSTVKFTLPATKCKYCNEVFKSRLKLSQHLKEYHNEILVSKRNRKNTFCIACKYCGKTFTKKTSLLTHEYIHEHGMKSLSCDVCSSRFSHQQTLNDHILLKHTKGTISCKQCPLKFASTQVLSRHVYRHHKMNQPVFCSLCQIKYANKLQLNRHIAKKHKNKPYVVNTEESKYQCVVNAEESKYQCDECSSVFKTRRDISRHLQVVHLEKKIPCYVCAKLFKTNLQVKQHMVVHTKERNYECEICKAKLVSKPALTYHLRLHSGERPYKCSFCDADYVSASARLEHERRKHIGPQLPCKVCQKKFKTYCQLRKHERRHLNPNNRLKKH